MFAKLPLVATDHSAVHEVALALGVEAESVAQWADLGLLGPDAGSLGEEALERARLVLFAQRRGYDAEQIAQASASQGDLLGQFVGLLGQGGRRRLVEGDEMEGAAGLDAAALRRLRTALGIADDDVVDGDDVESMRTFATVLDAGFPEDALLQLVRVFADALGRVADAEARLFHYYVHERQRAAGLEGDALQAHTKRVADRVVGFAEPAVLYFHRRAFARALLDDFLLHVDEAVAPPAPVTGETTMTVVFVDLCGFTPLTETMGDTVAALVVDRFSEIVRTAVVRHGGRLVKQIGDAFMLVFGQPTDAVACGVEIERLAAGEHEFPPVRIGANHGRLLYREGDYLGTTVNVAARVAGIATADQFIVTDAVREQARIADDVDVVPLGQRSLKGIATDVGLHLVRRTDVRPPRVVDPVCHMALDPDAAGVAAQWRGEPVYFCSSDCATRFFAEPERWS